VGLTATVKYEKKRGESALLDILHAYTVSYLCHVQEREEDRNQNRTELVSCRYEIEREDDRAEKRREGKKERT
jgi:hypothetical protein